MKTKTKAVGDLVWLDSYSARPAKKHTIDMIDYKFNPDTGEKFAIYLVDDNWYDSRTGKEYKEYDIDFSLDNISRYYIRW
jgi:hypothetical protein